MEPSQRWERVTRAVNIVGNTGNETNVSSLLSGSLTYIYMYIYLCLNCTVYIFFYFCIALLFVGMLPLMMYSCLFSLLLCEVLISGTNKGFFILNLFTSAAGLVQCDQRRPTCCTAWVRVRPVALCHMCSCPFFTVCQIKAETCLPRLVWHHSVQHNLTPE